MNDVLVIGYGNPLRSDDAVGWRAARALLEEGPGEGVRVEAAHQLTIEMAEDIAEAGFVIFVDAWWGAVPGRLRSHRVHPEISASASLTHHVTLETLLATARHLYGHCPEAVLISIGGESFEHGERFSDSVEAAFPDLLMRIKTLVSSHSTRAGSGKVKSRA